MPELLYQKWFDALAVHGQQLQNYHLHEQILTVRLTVHRPAINRMPKIGTSWKSSFQLLQDAQYACQKKKHGRNLTLAHSTHGQSDHSAPGVQLTGDWGQASKAGGSSGGYPNQIAQVSSQVLERFRATGYYKGWTSCAGLLWVTGSAFQVETWQM